MKRKEVDKLKAGLKGKSSRTERKIKKWMSWVGRKEVDKLGEKRKEVDKLGKKEKVVGLMTDSIRLSEKGKC